MEKVLVYGASGDQGIPLVNALIKRGYKIRAASRFPENYNSEIKGDVESVKADLFNLDSLMNASKNIDCIAMNLPFVFDRDIAKQWGDNITKAGKEMGVKKIVFNTSCYVAPNDNGLAAHDGRREIEKSMAESGMEYAVIRSVVFMDNLSRFWAKPSIVKSNIFAYPCSEKLKISWICLEDVAAFMVAALSDKEVKAEKITVGGPEILCGHEVAEIFSKALKRQITFQSLEPNTFARKMSKIVTGSEEYEKPSIYGGMAAFYRWYNEQNPSPLAIEMSDLYNRFLITPTFFEDWIKKHDWDII